MPVEIYTYQFCRNNRPTVLRFDHGIKVRFKIFANRAEAEVYKWDMIKKWNAIGVDTIDRGVH
jgi:hypothetical protein